MIYVVTHKPLGMTFPDGYKVLRIGEDDCRGDNIGEKNPYYSELTGLYSMYRNTEDGIIGLDHYRRFFVDRSHLFRFAYLKGALVPLSFKKAEKILNRYDIILPLKYYMKESAYDDYARHHLSEDLDLTKNVLHELYPDYDNAFTEVMDRNYLYSCNMMICSRAVFNDYCRWLFDVLFEVEKRTNLGKYGEDRYNARVFGFLSERLLNVYVLKNNLSIKEMPVVNLSWKPFHNSLYYRNKLISETLNG